MTIKDCIDMVDNIKPNQYTIKDKVMWLSFIEGVIINDVLKTHEGYDGKYDDFSGYSEDKLSVPLIVQSPYDRLYTAYLKMKIDEENGETARYNNSAAMFNSYMDEFKKYYNKTHMPLNITDKATTKTSNKPSVGLSEAEFENLKKDMTYILTEHFAEMMSEVRIAEVIREFAVNNMQMLKGKDGYTPIRGTDYFNESDKEAIRTYVASLFYGNPATTPMASPVIKGCSDNSLESGNSVAGIKGYYCYKYIPTDAYTGNRVLVVTDKQYTKNDNFYQYNNIIDTTKIAVGDKISICNGIRVYFECSTVVDVSSSFIVVDTVPFEHFDNITTNDVEQSDRFIFIANKPDAGYSTIGDFAISLGNGNKAINFGAFSCGISNNSIGAGSFTAGVANIAEFLASASGLKTVAGPYAHAQNMYVEATGIGSSGEGYKTKVPGTYAHGEGQETEASAPCAHSQNFKTKATAPAAHAQNNQTEASGENSDATGFKTKSKAKNSHTGGEENTTETTAVNGFTEGYKNTNRAPRSFIAGGQWNSTSADANDSLVHGIGSSASAPAQRVGGKYPKGDPQYLEIVGNGKSSSARSNAYTLDTDGNACFSGSVECNGIIVKSPNGTRFKLTVSDSGTISASKV